MAIERNTMHVVQRILAHSPELTSEDFKSLPDGFNPYKTTADEEMELLEIYHSLSEQNRIALMDSAKKSLYTEKNNPLL